jgi:hypothetical protein
MIHQLPSPPMSAAHRLPLMNGTKLSATYPRSYGREGTLFQAFGETFEIVKIVQLPLSYVANIFFIAEGYRSPAEFIEAWEDHYPGSGFRPGQIVYMHIFHRIVITKDGPKGERIRVEEAH